jgi:hypothetical protein
LLVCLLSAAEEVVCLALLREAAGLEVVLEREGLLAEMSAVLARSGKATTADRASFWMLLAVALLVVVRDLRV